MEPKKHDIIFYVGLGVVLTSLVVLLINIPMQQESDFWEIQTHLEDLDSFKLDVHVLRKDHGTISFNGTYSTTTLEYQKLNGRRFEWDGFYPPFVLEKKSGNDTITLSKGRRKYYFLMIHDIDPGPFDWSINGLLSK